MRLAHQHPQQPVGEIVDVVKLLEGVVDLAFAEAGEGGARWTVVGAPDGTIRAQAGS